MTTQLRRTAVALATTLATLALLAGPTSASVHAATITGGTITSVNGTNTTTFTFGGAAGAGCSQSIGITADHTAGTINITSFAVISHFILGGTHYVTIRTRSSSTTGSASGGNIGGTPLGDPTITITVEIYPATSTASGSTSVDCTPRSARSCSLRAHNIALAGSYTPATDTTHGSMGSGSTFVVSSTGGGNITNVVGATCGSPFNAFAGGTATISNMTGDITS